MKKCIIIIVLFVFLSSVIYCATYKKDIRQASTIEIESVYGIGPVLAMEIKEYCIIHNIKSIDELDIKYIGEKRKAELKKKFK